MSLAVTPYNLQPTTYHLRPGMRLLVHLLQPLDARVGVDLSRAQARVTQQLLHRPKIGPGIQQMRGEGVAQGVHPQAIAADGFERPMDQALYAARSEPPSTTTHEDRLPVGAGEPHRSLSSLQVPPEGTARPISYRGDGFLPPPATPVPPI